MNYKLKKISGDASFREFYRLQKNKKNTIIVKANKEKYQNLIVYTLVNKILNNNNVKAPILIKQFFSNSIIEINDLGQKTFLDFVKHKKKKFKFYKKLIDKLIKIQRIQLKKKYNYYGYKIKFKKYDIKSLQKESNLFFEWYVKYFSKNKKSVQKNKIKKELKRAYTKLYFKNEHFTHRDFHASNVMVGKNIGIIDSQDAVVGNRFYDLVSLIDDVRIKLPSNLQERLFNFYYSKSKLKKEQYKNLKNDFEILSVQRNLKILGIFVRLFKRDGKPNYLKYLPYTWRLIERRLKNPVFENFNLMLKKYLKIQKLKKINNL
mgnify:CR=1 FL=1